MNFITKNWKGILLCLVIAVPCWFLGQTFPIIGGPVFGILAGMIITLLLKDKSMFQDGITFVSKKVLQYAVILLGFGLNLSVILETGKQSLPIIVTTISTSLIIAYLLHKVMHVPGNISTLVGVGSSICGGSAIAATAPVIDADDDKRTALYLLNNVLGGPGMNSKLNVSLRERRGLVYNVESNLTSYTDTGAFCIYFGTDIEDMDTCLKLTYKELKRMRDVKMTSSQLAAAKKQLIGQIGVASDNFENNALGMAKTFLHYHKYESSELVFKRIEALTAETLLEVANEMFAEEYLSTLIYK